MNPPKAKSVVISITPNELAVISMRVVHPD